MMDTGQIIGYHVDREKLTCATGETWGEGINWLGALLDHKPFVAKICYDLDYAVAALLAHEGMTQEQGKKLLETHNLHLNTGYRLAYYPGKVFTIDYGFGAAKAYALLYNAGQYTDIHHVLDKAVSYAINKAKEAQKVGEDVLTSYSKLGIASESLTSPIKAFEKSDLYPDIPTVDDIPEEAVMLAYESLKGNWVECYKLGSWDMVYDWDISGAYPGELAKLLDTRQGKWIEAMDIPRLAYYGFAKGWLTINKPFHPFITSRGTTSHTLVGSRETCLTLQQIEFLVRNKLGSFDITQAGWWWLPTGEKHEPFRATVDRLWGLRQDTDAMTTDIAKRVLVGLWGKMLEFRGIEDDAKLGDRFNPVSGAIVEVNNQLTVAQTCLDNNVIPLAVSVDGILTDRLLKLDGDGGLGQWRLSHKGKCIIVSSGIIGIEGKGANEEFSISYDWLIEELGDKPGQKEYTMDKLSPVTLARALHIDGWDRLGELTKSTRKVCIGNEVKRCYVNKPKCGGDLLENIYSSDSWDISIIAGGDNDNQTDE